LPSLGGALSANTGDYGKAARIDGEVNQTITLPDKKGNGGLRVERVDNEKTPCRKPIGLGEILKRLSRAQWGRGGKEGETLNHPNNNGGEFAGKS